MKKIKFEEFEILFKPIEFYLKERDNVEGRVLIKFFHHLTFLLNLVEIF